MKQIYSPTGLRATASRKMSKMLVLEKAKDIRCPHKVFLVSVHPTR